MKKYIVLFTLLALFVSCTKEQGQGEDQLTPPAPEVVKYESDFLARIDSSSVATKTWFDAADGNMLKWTTDDGILISNGTQSMSYYIKEGGGTNASLYFTTGEELSGTEFFAVYPLSGSAYSAGTYTVTIPTTQSYKQGNIAENAFPMVGYCGPVKALRFKNAGAVLAIRPMATLADKITSVTVSANENLVGSCSVTWGGSGDPVVNCTGSNTLTIDCAEGISWGETIYASVAPGTYTNLNFTINYTGGSVHYTYRGACQVGRSTIKKLTVDCTYVVQCTDLGATQTANCYPIKDCKGGKYRFPITVKGNGQTIASRSDISSQIDLSQYKDLYVYVYYTVGIGACSPTIFSVEPFIEGDYICFELPEIKDAVANGFTVSSDDCGSALVALSTNPTWSKGEGMEAIWSWMIWYNPALRDHFVPSEDDATASQYTFLNMDLGSHTTAYVEKGNGHTTYYYQFGRKDPMYPMIADDLGTPFISKMTPESTHDGKLSYANTVANPHVFYGYGSFDSGKTYDWCHSEHSNVENKVSYDWWNANQTNKSNVSSVKKTMFDPCPPGYHVMSEAAMRALINIAINDPTTTMVRASNYSIGFGNSWEVNFPAWGNRRPSIDNAVQEHTGNTGEGNGTYGAVQRYTTWGSFSTKGEPSAQTMYIYSKQRAGTGETEYINVQCNIDRGIKNLATSFTRAVATPIRCQKQQ